MDTVSSLRVVKASKVGSDSIFTFNSVYFANSGFDSSNIFGQKMIQKSNGEYLFVWKEKDKYKDTILLKSTANIGEQWSLCNTCNTIAKYEGKMVYQFLGIQDSAMRISTDRGFEILISKKYGIVKTIDFKKYLKYNFVKTLFIDAIPEAGLGRFANDFRNIFDFQVGDVFVTKFTFQPSLGPPYYVLTRKQILARGESINKDTLYYTTKIDIKKYDDYQIENSMGIYKHDTIIEKYYKEKKENYFSITKLLSQEIQIQGHSTSNIIILFNKKENRYTIQSMTDPFSPAHKTYRSQLGEIKSSEYGESSGNSYETILLCYTKANERLNDCSIYDEIITSAEQIIENNAALKIFPNPTTGLITVGDGQIHSFTNIQILNALGMVVMEEKFTNTINLEALPTGVYWLKAEDLKGRLMQTKVVKK